MACGALRRQGALQLRERAVVGGYGSSGSSSARSSAVSEHPSLVRTARTQAAVTSRECVRSRLRQTQQSRCFSSSSSSLSRSSEPTSLRPAVSPFSSPSGSSSFGLRCSCTAFVRPSVGRPNSILWGSSSSSPSAGSVVAMLRRMSTTTPRRADNKATTTPATTPSTSTTSKTTTPATIEPEQDHLGKHGFQRSEKAEKATQVNMAARLSREGKTTSKAGWGEVWRLIRIARPEFRWLAVAFVFLLFSSGVSMSIPFSVGRLLDLATKGAVDDVRILGLTMNQFFAAFGAVLTIGAAASFLRIIILRIVGERVVSRLRAQLYRRTYTQDAEFFDANRVGDLISRLSSDTVIVGKSITHNLSDGMRAIVSGSAGLVAMMWLSPKLTSILLIMFPPIAVGAVVYGRVIRNISRRIQRNLGTLTKIAEERLGNIRTSQAFAGEVQEVSRYNKQVRKIFSLGRREALISATYFGANGWFGNMTILALLIVGGNLVRYGQMSVGDLTSFMMYTAFAGSSMFGISGFYSELMKGAGAATRLFELLDRDPSIHTTVGQKVVSAQGPIRFKDVTFAYPTRPAVNIFQGLDFEIPSGSNVCIVGPSGGGKSTVASLLLRFYDPSQGSISINGTDVKSMNVKSLRRRIGMVAQEPVLFSGTIAENISYGKPEASRADIIAAAQKANCQFISDFPDGLETHVGPRGAQLSGGQKQRIAIARALLKDPDILILDEATSALDAESETLVNAALAALLKGRSTTISIAHRLSTIKRSDQIIVLSNQGTVAETGRYADLSADPNSAFSRLMEWQMSGGEVTASPPRNDGHVTEKERIEDDLEEPLPEEEEEEDLEEDEEVEEHRRKNKTKASPAETIPKAEV
ncbi:ATP-binding cassette permease mdl1 [Sporothrix stenoceras]|uniref:ATP-binding cassette permease mdl1 n=1 Tax=Sporothrix stenoceras TaxID=5173 RepID=A0ABR3ZHU1_9PEZI